MNSFVEKELKNIQEISEMKFYDGRVSFDCRNIDVLFRLKTIERAFIDICSDTHLCGLEGCYDDNFTRILDNIRSISSSDLKKYCLLINPSLKNSTISFRLNLKSKGLSFSQKGLIFHTFFKQIRQGGLFLKNLRNSDIEICIHMNKEGVFIGIPISKEPISLRQYSIGLRTTTANVLLMLLSEFSDTHSLVIDPFCGKGTIICEALDFKSSHFLGMDCERSQLDIFKNNLRLNGPENAHPILSNIDFTCLRDGIADAIVSDIPFGNKFDLTIIDVFCKLELWLSAIGRMLKKSGIAILLVSYACKNLITYYATGKVLFENEESTRDYSWVLLKSHTLPQANTLAEILVLKKVK